MGAETRRVMLFGLDVRDDVLYQRYRDQMTPILLRYGGSFGYDFVVAETLKSEVEATINRVFTIVFPDREVAARFFGDEEYKKVRAAFFAPAVGEVTSIAEFEQRRVAR